MSLLSAKQWSVALRSAFIGTERGHIYEEWSALSWYFTTVYLAKICVIVMRVTFQTQCSKLSNVMKLNGVFDDKMVKYRRTWLDFWNICCLIFLIKFVSMHGLNIIIFFVLVCVHFDNPSYIWFYLKKKVSCFEMQMLLLNEPWKDKVVKAVVHIYEHCKCCFPGRTIYSEFLLLLF